MTESWLPVPNFPGYEVSDMGRVRSYLGRNPRILKTHSHPDGYEVVGLRKGKKTHTLTVHRLVALAFLGPRPDGMEVCHGPGGLADNSLSNLKYDTHQANMRDSTIFGARSCHWETPTPIEAKEQA